MPIAKPVTCGHEKAAHYGHGLCLPCYKRWKRSDRPAKVIVDPPLTPCELAFAAHLRMVLENSRVDGDLKHISDRTVVGTWHEAFEDWVEAVRYGQTHPLERNLRSFLPRVTLKPAFLGKQNEDDY